MKINREQAWELLKRYNKDEALIKHALAVEAVMRHFARINNEDEETWGIVGLLHDLDYEMYPEEHCTKAKEIMENEGLDEIYIRGMMSHGWEMRTDVKPESLMEKTVYTIDELTGLINAACLLRPSKSVMDIEVKSVKKKFKSPSFAVGVKRDVIEKGCEMLGKDLDYVINETILGMREAAESIGLKGNL